MWFFPPRPLPPLAAITSHIRSFVPGRLHGACCFAASRYGGTSQPVCSRKSTLRSERDVPVCRAEPLAYVGLWNCGYVNICSHGLRTSRRCAPSCSHNHLGTVRTTLGRCCNRGISVSTRQQGDAVRKGKHPRGLELLIGRACSSLQEAALGRRSASAACTAPSCSGRPARAPSGSSCCVQSSAHGRSCTHCYQNRTFLSLSYRLNAQHKGCCCLLFSFN